MGLIRRGKGLLAGWKQSINLTQSFFLNVGLFIELRIIELGKTLSITNMDGPYEDKKFFKDNFFTLGILKEYSVILGRDLRLTTKIGEICKTNAI